MRRRVHAGLVGLAVGAMALAAAACGGGSSSTGASGGSQATGSGGGGELTLTIGYSGALSGPYAAYDQPLLNGMEMAAKQIENAGGYKGVHIKIVSKDNKDDQTLTATTTQELLDQGIKVFVLSTADVVTAEGLLVAQGGGISSVGANTAGQIVKDVGPSTFMIVAPDNEGAAAGGQYACETGYRNAYLLGSPEIPYTKLLPQYFADAFAHDCDGKITGEDTYKIGQTDFGTQVTKIQNANPQPDVIYTSIFVPDSGVFLKQLRSAGVTIPVVTVDGNDSSLFVDSGGSAVDGVVYTTHAFPTPGSLDEKFISDYTQLMGKKPESNTIEAMGRDNIYVFAEAAARAGSTDPKAILDQVLALKDFQLVTGKMSLDPESRLPVKEVTLVKMKGTDFTFLDAFTPEYIPQP
jgi:branched-chain amino acid transport system substrate-binding protein